MWLRVYMCTQCLLLRCSDFYVCCYGFLHGHSNLSVYMKLYNVIQLNIYFDTILQILHFPPFWFTLIIRYFKYLIIYMITSWSLLDGTFASVLLSLYLLLLFLHKIKFKTTVANSNRWTKSSKNNTKVNLDEQILM